MQQNEIASRGYIIEFEHWFLRLEPRKYIISSRRCNKHTNGPHPRPLPHLRGSRSRVGEKGRS